jgi:hypothetical protein
MTTSHARLKTSSIAAPVDRVVPLTVPFQRVGATDLPAPEAILVRVIANQVFILKNQEQEEIKKNQLSLIVRN